MKKKTTLQDIAKNLGISTSTVSRALQDNPRISETMRKKVIDLAYELNYFDKKFPENFTPKKLNAIGVIVPKISYHLYAMAISGIEKVAEENGMHLVICQSNESFEREKSLTKELIETGVSGLIVSLAGETKQFEHFLELKKKNIPLVLFNRQCDEVETDKVVIDNFKASYDATEHLISLGCKNIAYIGGPKKLQISNTRLFGYQQALQDADIGIEYIEHCNFSKESNLSAARKLLYSPNPPDGIIAFSDQVAISAMLAAKERGLSIPEDLAIIGFNNEPVDELLEPSLTSVNQPAYKMGYEAAELIFDRIQTPDKDYIQKVLKSDLVIRNSTNKNKLK
ncbi:LacI family DNA-binding transcriptional regulator [Seonamhaeicola aphaedonensis]|uniref:LacI family transcriptional regulator n=1 Tax=Seonamhaeicola aphaedonensis TaxID=1461338 RepID=A0A3D9HIL1_9FLAO|nr:LacI family DNA-binding transcriptional regulator [Seonamhaeicola aphaedonensis]RED49265.1 LacI family transcriptional regulator [Seonamhaeicola aphaedonensis]